jgi:hypothetical protein
MPDEPHTDARKRISVFPTADVNMNSIRHCMYLKDKCRVVLGIEPQCLLQGFVHHLAIALDLRQGRYADESDLEQ